MSKGYILMEWVLGMLILGLVIPIISQGSFSAMKLLYQINQNIKISHEAIYTQHVLEQDMKEAVNFYVTGHGHLVFITSDRPISYDCIKGRLRRRQMRYTLYLTSEWRLETCTFKESEGGLIINLSSESYQVNWRLSPQPHHGGNSK